MTGNGQETDDDNMDHSTEDIALTLKILTRFAAEKGWNNERYPILPQQFMEHKGNISRLPKSTLIDILSQFSNQSVVASLRIDLFNQLLLYLEKSQLYTLHSRTTHPNLVASDIYYIIQFLVTDPQEVGIEHLGKICKLIKAHKPIIKNGANDEINELRMTIYELNHVNLEVSERLTGKINSLISLVDTLVSQNKSMTIENNNLKDTINTINNNTSVISNRLNNNDFPPLPSSAVHEVVRLPAQTPVPSNKRSYSAISNHDNSAAAKKNNNAQQSNSIIKNKQQALKSFDSNKPELPNKELYEKNDKGFKMVMPKKIINNPKKYIDSLGTNTSSSLSIRPRMQRMYICNIQPSSTQEEVQSFLDNISFDNKKLSSEQLTKEPVKHKYWHAYTFYIPYDQREVVNDKSIWPRGMRVDLSYAPRPKQTETTTQATSSTAKNNP